MTTTPTLEGLADYLRWASGFTDSDANEKQFLAWIEGVEAARRQAPTDDEIRAVWNRTQDPIATVRVFTKGPDHD